MGILYFGGHDKTSFKCEECGEIFRTQKAKDIHKRIYHSKKRVLKPKLSKSERYQKEFMATCSICGDSKPKEDFAYLNVNICKKCDFEKFKESVRCAET